MFNKPLSRPMFRRGGRAGGGIMTGVETPKRGQVDGPGSYAGDNEKIGFLDSFSSGTRTAIDNDNNKLIKTNVELIALPQLSNLILHKKNFIFSV